MLVRSTVVIALVCAVLTLVFTPLVEIIPAV